MKRFIDWIWRWGTRLAGVALGVQLCIACLLLMVHHKRDFCLRGTDPAQVVKDCTLSLNSLPPLNRWDDRLELKSTFHAARAVAHGRLEELESARIDMQAAVDLWPRQEEFRLQLARFTLMTANGSEQKLHETKRALNMYLDRNRHSPVAWLLYAGAEFDLGNWKEAVAYFDKALPSFSPIELPHSFMLRAYALYESKSYARAIAEASVLFSVGLKPSDNLWIRALSYCAPGQLDEAVSDFEQMHESAPEIFANVQEWLIEQGYLQSSDFGLLTPRTRSALRAAVEDDCGAAAEAIQRG